MTDVVSVKSPAKINLFLRVINRREDGYHNIASLMQMVGLYDLLTFRITPHKISLQVAGYSLPTDGSNLIVMAARRLQSLISPHRNFGVAISLNKRIPVSAGLGGGSSNAAATLIALNRLWALGMTREQLASIGASIGSDVPFFLYGPTAWVTGRGETVRKAQALPSYWVVLVNPGVAVSSAWAYGQLESSGERGVGMDVGLTNKGLPITMSGLSVERPSVEEMLNTPQNDLEAMTLAAFPSLVRIKERLQTFGGKAVLMSGSGPTLFAIFEGRDAAKCAALAMRGEGQVWVAKTLRRDPICPRRVDDQLQVLVSGSDAVSDEN